jgi:hypothetical protein
MGPRVASEGSTCIKIDQSMWGGAHSHLLESKQNLPLCRSTNTNAILAVTSLRNWCDGPKRPPASPAPPAATSISVRNTPRFLPMPMVRPHAPKLPCVPVGCAAIRACADATDHSRLPKLNNSTFCPVHRRRPLLLSPNHSGRRNPYFFVFAVVANAWHQPKVDQYELPIM